ncbi:heparinase II/III family protein [Corynebacterium sp. YSMAA1_1_D6]|uniref:heparinase II/III domain-containing protein n=1 Tax=Corynebacterium sp. YSMAA1_1_D6 TaxID=3383589 RepID=UPI0038D0A3C5
MSEHNFVNSLYLEWSMGWGWTLQKKDEMYVVKNSINATHPVEQDPEGWNDLIRTTGNKSEMLWVLSLNYLVDIAKIDPSYAETALLSFYDVFTVSRHELAVFLGTSWDHCCAMRLKALVALSSAQSPLRQSARKLLEDEIQGEDYWALIVRNNHGLMLLESLIAAQIASNTSDKHFFHRAALRLEEILSYVFGEDGFCNENSTFYHHLYIRILGGMIEKFDKVESCREVVLTANRYFDLATESIRKICLHDGSLPPLGDSNPISTKYDSVLGTAWSQRTGLWVYKSEELYLSYKCGFESDVHKHADDTSLSLRFRGEDLILDSGTCNYDYSDPRVFSLRTQAGHSGLYFRKFDAVHPAKLYGDAGMVISGLVSPLPRAVRGGYLASGNYVAHRAVKLLSNEHFRVEDWWSSISAERPVHRFIVPTDVRIEYSPKEIVLLGEKAQLRIRTSERVRCEINVGEQSGTYRGWISRLANEVEPAQCLEVQTRNPRNNSLSFDMHIQGI